VFYLKEAATRRGETRRESGRNKKKLKLTILFYFKEPATKKIKKFYKFSKLF
jgi:hypothetical protein